MKQFRNILVIIALFATTTASAQLVNTLYFLENAPYRHYINPALSPISKMYLSLTPLGGIQLGVGTTGLTMSDLIYNHNGQTVTFLHPDVNGRETFLQRLNPSLGLNLEAQLNILSFGFRIKEQGYFHLTINERLNGDVALPGGLFNFLLGGGMKELSGKDNYYELKQLGANIDVYTEVGMGYSHEFNEQWAIGVKAKLLMGQAHIGLKNKDLALNASSEEWSLKGNGALEAAAPISLHAHLSLNEFENYNPELPYKPDGSMDIMKLIKPAGWGAAVDLGVTYKPAHWVQISAAATDLGLMYWKGNRYQYKADGLFRGVGELKYSDLVDANGQFQTQILMDTALTALKEVGANCLQETQIDSTFIRMVNPNLNVGVDFNFWDNRVGIGVYSRTKFASRIYEEVTIGAAFRPCHWFQIAASYSFMNGRWSNIGVGLGLVTYEGIGLTLAMDYVPCSYAAWTDANGKEMHYIPYKTQGVNLALGLNIVVGHRRDKDRDGVKDKFDICPDTPRGVKVDKDGCPIDTDGDGVPDYLDNCPDTPEAAYGLIDTNGCPIDSDNDGVADYLDLCPETPEGVIVDENGCPVDTDGDGVADYLDLCPDTPQEAWGTVDENGCPKDTDGDGVLDYLDQCPDTPAGAPVDENGCPADSDGDGVADYLDQCPDTPAGVSVDEFGCPNDDDNDGVPNNIDECPNTPAGVLVDEKGCPTDADGDGVPDYLDQCPTVPGDPRNQGCPIIQKSVTTLLTKAMSGIQFETGKAVIKKQSYNILDQIANVFIEHPEYYVEVQGHTDNVGSEATNLDLSQRRAEAVKAYLVKKGVPQSRLVANGYGMSQPIDTNETSAGRAKNRRVEFKISFEETHTEDVYIDGTTVKTEENQ